MFQTKAFFFFFEGLNATCLTCVPHEFSRDLLVAASAAEDLSTKPTVVPAAKCGEFLAAVVTLLTLAVRHPVLLEITVLRKKRKNKTIKSQHATPYLQKVFRVSKAIQ